jgi:predicted DNA-binding transcriptional regulator YafY
VKINRLLEITLILLNRGSVTARELAERFGVSTRTIYRDIDVLSTSGVPVYTNKGNNGGISLLENYTFSRALVTDHERDSILLALKTLQATKYPEIDTILDKLGSIFKNAAGADWVHVEFSPWGSGPEEEEKFTNIKKAILESRVVTCDYVNAEGNRSRRSIEPMQLVFKGQAWYLWGYCRFRQDFRTFRISRMKDLSLTAESFRRRSIEEVRRDESPESLKQIVTLKLRFQPDVLFRLYDDYDKDRIIENDDGTYEIIVTYPEDEWVYRHIMSFGSSVEVIEPEHIRRIIKEKTEKTLNIYRNDS